MLPICPQNALPRGPLPRFLPQNTGVIQVPHRDELLVQRQLENQLFLEPRRELSRQADGYCIGRQCPGLGGQHGEATATERPPKATDGSLTFRFFTSGTATAPAMSLPLRGP